MFKYYRVYTDVDKYESFQTLMDGTLLRKVPNDYPEMLAWKEQGNVIEKKSGDRFLIVSNNTISVDPNKDAIIAAELKQSEKSAKNILLESIRQKQIDAVISWVLIQPNPPKVLTDLENQKGEL